jgi:hypothetical protein
MYKDMSIIITSIIIALLIIPSLRSMKSSKKLAAEQEIIDAERALLLEVDAIVSDEALPEDEFYEKTKEIFDKLETLKKAKSDI